MNRMQRDMTKIKKIKKKILRYDAIAIYYIYWESFLFFVCLKMPFAKLAKVWKKQKLMLHDIWTISSPKDLSINGNILFIRMYRTAHWICKLWCRFVSTTKIACLKKNFNFKKTLKKSLLRKGEIIILIIKKNQQKNVHWPQSSAKLFSNS